MHPDSIRPPLNLCHSHLSLTFVTHICHSHVLIGYVNSNMSSICELLNFPADGPKLPKSRTRKEALRFLQYREIPIDGRNELVSFY